MYTGASAGRRVQRSVWGGGCCRRTRTSSKGALRGIKGRLDAWRDSSAADPGAPHAICFLLGWLLLVCFQIQAAQDAVDAA